MTIKRITFLRELLAFIGLEGRLHLEWISSAEAQKFARVVTDFTEKIRRLGPNPLRRLVTESITRRPQPVSEREDHSADSTPVRATDEFRQAKTA
jgi:hypothetical protein